MPNSGIKPITTLSIDGLQGLEDYLGTVLAVPLMKRGLKKTRDIVPKTLHSPAIHYARHRRKAMHFLSQGIKPSFITIATQEIYFGINLNLAY